MSAAGPIFVVTQRMDDEMSAWDQEVLNVATALARELGVATALVPLFGALQATPNGVAVDLVADVPDLDRSPECQVAWLEALVDRERPCHIVGADVIPGPGDLLRRLAARRHLSFTGSVYEVGLDAVCMLVEEGRGELEQPLPMVIACAPGCVTSLAPATRSEASAAQLPALTDDPRVSIRLHDAEDVCVDRGYQAVEEADLILAAGSGVSDWHLFHELAAALNATEGATRVVCDAGLMPRDSQVGSSGSMARARCYVALGISGAPQHLEGIEGCARVVAVNVDPHAQIMRRADLGIVADAQAVMREMLGALRAARMG